MNDLINYKLTDIGHNDCVNMGGRVYHIQTEVISAASVKIKTTVFQGGAVVDAIQQDLSGAKNDSNDLILQTAKIQHERAVKEVRDGKYLSDI
jgi:hypothetical protein